MPRLELLNFVEQRTAFRGEALDRRLALFGFEKLKDKSPRVFLRRFANEPIDVNIVFALHAL